MSHMDYHIVMIWQLLDVDWMNFWIHKYVNQKKTKA